MCKFCDISNGIYTHKEIDIPFFESDDFFSIVSIGALVEGWTLIIPRKHMLSLRSQYSLSNFNDFTNVIIKKLQKKYGGIVAFEHGSYLEKSLTSCGTDHAHLHLVPFKSLLIEMEQSGLVFEKCKASDIVNIVGTNEYLFYCEINDSLDSTEGYLHILNEPISQFFRRVIASMLGIGDAFDYRLYPNINISQVSRNNLVNEVFTEPKESLKELCVV